VLAGRVQSLDLLRLIACAIVLWGHGLHMLPGFVAGATPLGPSRGRSALAVATFFVISGYVITRRLLRDKAGGLSIGRFMLRRAMRVLPAYFLCVGVVAIILRLVPGVFTPGRTDHWSQFVYLYNLFYAHCYDRLPPLVQAHMWSLCVEEHFYLVWPLLVWMLSRRASLAAAGGLMTLSLLSWYVWQDNHRAIYGSTLANVAPIGAGVLMAYADAWARSLRALPIAAASMVLGWICWQDAVAAAPVMAAWSRLLMGGGLVLLALSTDSLWMPRLTARPLVATALAHAGMMTYGLYLYHIVVFHLTYRALGAVPRWYALPAAVLATSLVTLASFYLMERPLMSLAARRAVPRRQRRAAPPDWSALPMPG
jgi:peptidoglycan/LPS O-acetylase OafA/YrhL